ncbi:MAG: hypothetical protein ACK52I_00415 [Pseudomonadota bacterium]
MPRLASAGRSAIDPDRTRAAHARRRPLGFHRVRPTLTSSGRDASTGSQRPFGGGRRRVPLRCRAHDVRPNQSPRAPRWLPDIGTNLKVTEPRAAAA